MAAAAEEEKKFVQFLNENESKTAKIKQRRNSFGIECTFFTFESR